MVVRKQRLLYFIQLWSKSKNVRQFNSTQIYFKPNINVNMHRPSAFDKKVLLKAKMYASIEEIPEKVTWGKMLKARDLYRIRMSIWMAISGAAFAFCMLMYSKSLAKRGVSLSQEGLDNVHALREQGRLEREAKEKKNNP